MQVKIEVNHEVFNPYIIVAHSAVLKRRTERISNRQPSGQPLGKRKLYKILSLSDIAGRQILTARRMKHHLMVGTWTPPGRIYTLQFDDEELTLSLLKKTDIPEDEPISWMAISVCLPLRNANVAN